MRPLSVRLLRRLTMLGRVRLAARVLPHVPAAGLAWLRAVGWAWRRRLLARPQQHELWITRPDGVPMGGVVPPVPGSRGAVLGVGGTTGPLHGPAWICPELCAPLQ